MLKTITCNHDTRYQKYMFPQVSIDGRELICDNNTSVTFVDVNTGQPSIPAEKLLREWKLGLQNTFLLSLIILNLKYLFYLSRLKKMCIGFLMYLAIFFLNPEEEFMINEANASFK